MCREGLGERVTDLLEEMCGLCRAYHEKRLVTASVPSGKLRAAAGVLTNSAS